MSLTQAFSLFGGLGLFLLGMWMMTDGLKLVAGPSLRTLLARWTRSRWHGLAVGFFVTALVQSSSAVTVAVIGFVNAGLLTLPQALWVVFGSNVGTTMTGWLVALIGFNFKIGLFALPLVGLGMAMRLGAGGTRREAVGLAVAGFGLFFLGIDVLRDAFTGLAAAVDVAALATGSILSGAIFVGIGFLLTVLTQSSSASIALALSAMAGGLLTIEPAAAVIIGANLGTTSTGLLAVIGATSNARRVAAGHFAFNLLTGAVALLLLPLLVLATAQLGAALDLGQEPVTLLALFHTVFNLLGVALIWPVADRLARWLSRRFVSGEEDEARPRFLDPTILLVPELAFEGLHRELTRLHEMTAALARDALGGKLEAVRRLESRREAIARLSEAIIDYVHRLNAARLPAKLAEATVHPLRAVLHYAEVVDYADAVLRAKRLTSSLPAALAREVDAYAALAADHLRLRDRAAEAGLETIEAAYDRLKTAILRAGSRNELGLLELDHLIGLIAQIRDMVRRMNKAQRRIAAVAAQPPLDLPRQERSGEGRSGEAAASPRERPDDDPATRDPAAVAISRPRDLV